MIDIKETKKHIKIKSDYYCAILSKYNGGTMCKLLFRGKNTGLYRDGCEYWTEEEHYEQEYGKILNIASEKHSDRFKIEINAQVVCPRDKIVGGNCITKYFFENKPCIKTNSLIYPLFENVVSIDKYVCFKNNNYKYFSANNDVNNIKKLLDSKGRMKKYYNNINKIKLNGNGRNIIIKTDKLSTKMRIYKTKNMLEIKPEWNNNIKNAMHMEYIG